MGHAADEMLGKDMKKKPMSQWMKEDVNTRMLTDDEKTEDQKNPHSHRHAPTTTGRRG